MKGILTIVLVVLLAGFSDQVKKKKILFFGDSITQAGVSPKGYITKMGELLTKKHLDDSYELIGSGIGGNKIYDLYLRMDTDVVQQHPDIVVIWVGVNDVWHKKSAGTGTDIDKFEKFYDAVIKKLKDANIKVYVCTPAVIGERTDFTNELDGDLNQYSVVIRRIAKENECKLIDLRKDFLAYNLEHNKENKESGVLTSDKVHLNEAGNSFVAEKMMAALIK